MTKTEFEISWGTLWRILIFGVIALLFYEGRQIFLGVFLAIIISSGLESIVDAMERIRLPRSVSVILIFLAALIALIVLIYTVVPFVLVEFNTIFAGTNAASLGGFGSFLMNLRASQSVSGAISKISSQFLSGNASPLDLFSNIVGSFGLAVAVIISSFYLSLGRDGVERFLEVVVPPDYEAVVMKVYQRSRKLIGSWFRMQMLASLIMGFIVWGGLTIIGVKYAFLIGVFAGIFELVPFLGPILAGSIAVVAALLTSTTLAFYTLIFFLLAQQFEANILIPLLSRRSIGLHPVIVIVALLIGAEIGGVLGIVISVPAAAVFQEVVQEWSTTKRKDMNVGL